MSLCCKKVHKIWDSRELAKPRLWDSSKMVPKLWNHMKSFWDHRHFSIKVKLVETLNNWVAEVQTKNRVVRAVIKGHEVCNSVELTWCYRWSKLKANCDTINFYEILQVDLYLLQREFQNLQKCNDSPGLTISLCACRDSLTCNCGTLLQQLYWKNDALNATNDPFMLTTNVIATRPRNEPKNMFHDTSRLSFTIMGMTSQNIRMLVITVKTQNIK